jgi:CO/xanthine dehydrogenase Mo-binding subunit
MSAPTRPPKRARHFRFGLWPAALEFGASRERSDAPRIGPKAQWKDGQLVLAGLAPLPLPALAATAHARNFVTGRCGAQLLSLGMVARPLFALWRTVPRRDRCAGAAQGQRQIRRINRVSVKFPPTDNNRIGTSYTSMCGTLVRIEIERATGALRIAKAYSVFECGKALVPEVVMGQAQGGFAMGVGYACSRRCRPLKAAPATASGISGNTSSRADRTCRCTTSKSRCCRR